MARLSMAHFTQYTKPDYELNWHHSVLCRYLDRFVSGDIKRLMVFMPPRHGKSELVSRRLPAYILGKFPDSQIIACSYSTDLASRMNRDVQRIIDDQRYNELFPGTNLYSSNVRTVSQGTYLRNSDIFEVVQYSGVYRSAGVGGGITGMGFTYGLIDDPIKNRQDANSPTVRESLWEWYTSTFYTRQEKNASILLTVTRWHEDDIAGRLLRQMANDEGDQWTILDFPAIAEEERHPEDIREPGEALWHNKYPLETLNKIHASIGDYDWSALYQQTPMPAGGGLFKREKFKIIDNAPPNIKRQCVYWDLALSEKTSADYTVGLLMGETSERNYIVLEVIRMRKEWDELPDELEKHMLRLDVKVKHGIESAFFHGRVVKKLLARRSLHSNIIGGVRVDTDKYTRALPFAARVGEGVVYVLNRAWTEDFLRELCSFPNGTNDDQVDAASGAYLMFEDKGLKATTKHYA